MAEGIEVRHRKGCASEEERRCNCRPSYRASLWSGRERKKIKKTFPSEAAAKTWLQDARVGLRKGTLITPKPITLRQAADAHLAGVRDGVIRTPRGEPYKPSVVRKFITGYGKVIPRFGDVRLGDIRHVDLQDWVEEMVGAGMGSGEVQPAVNLLRVIYRRAVKRGEVSVNPTVGLSLPAPRGRRERIADPAEAELLISVLPSAHGRALWATAMYAGLRLGELQVLRWDDVDLAVGTIYVRRNWDRESKQVIALKTRAAQRRVPIVPTLRDYLIELRMD